MKRIGAFLWAVALASALAAQEPAQFLNRYNIEFNPISYPQKTPQEAMKSIAKAIDAGRYEYLLAHLTDPVWVDSRVAEHRDLLFPKAELDREDDEIAGEIDSKRRKAKALEKQKKDRARTIVAFNRVIVLTRKHLDEDPTLVKELRLFARDGEWEIDDDRATATMKKITSRKVFLRKREDRWFMEERNR